MTKRESVEERKFAHDRASMGALWMNMGRDRKSPSVRTKALEEERASSTCSERVCADRN